MNKSMRNGFIDVQKFFYAWIVVVFHFYLYTREHFMGGATSVEFFLIVSGAYLFSGFERNTEGLSRENLLKYPVKYMKKRLLRFLPYTMPAFAFAFIVKIVITSDGTGINSVPYMIDSFVKNIWEVPLISMCGLNAGRGMINVVTWTISAMLIAEFVVINLLARGEKTFSSFLAPLAILIGCGFWAQIKDSDYAIWHGFTTFGVIRAFIMTCVGIYVWKCAKWLAGKKFTNKGRMLLTVVEISLHVIAVISMMYRNTRYYRMFLAVLFSIAITITISQQSYTVQWFKQSKITNFLGEWSITVYVIHQPINILLYRYFETPYEFYRIKFIYGALVIAVSLAFLYLARWITHITPKITAKMRSVLINNETDPKTKE